MSRYDKQKTLNVLNVEKIPLYIISSQIAITLVLLYDHLRKHTSQPKSSLSHRQVVLKSSRNQPEVNKKEAIKSYMEVRSKRRLFVKIIETLVAGESLLKSLRNEGPPQKSFFKSE